MGCPEICAECLHPLEVMRDWDERGDRFWLECPHCGEIYDLDTDELDYRATWKPGLGRRTRC